MNKNDNIHSFDPLSSVHSFYQPNARQQRSKGKSELLCHSNKSNQFFSSSSVFHTITTLQLGKIPQLQAKKLITGAMFFVRNGKQKWTTKRTHRAARDLWKKTSSRGRIQDWRIEQSPWKRGHWGCRREHRSRPNARGHNRSWNKPSNARSGEGGERRIRRPEGGHSRPWRRRGDGNSPRKARILLSISVNWETRDCSSNSHSLRDFSSLRWKREPSKRNAAGRRRVYVRKKKIKKEKRKKNNDVAFHVRWTNCEAPFKKKSHSGPRKKRLGYDFRRKVSLILVYIFLIIEFWYFNF